VTDLRDLRHEYAARGLDESELEADPIVMFGRWMADAVEAGIGEPNAMVLATVAASGHPAARTVLLKGLDQDGFVFYTNYSSRKGQELAANPACALLFPWHDLERQVRVEGTAARMPEEENQEYFSARPRGSQVGAWASPQSTVVESRSALDRLYDEAAERFGDGQIPVPPHWGGFRVRPETVEFWQGRTGRMHDRLRYRRTPDGWATDRLAP
jgi:pyridoxamine 5'-phosphate oxidase